MISVKSSAERNACSMYKVGLSDIQELLLHRKLDVMPSDDATRDSSGYNNKIESCDEKYVHNILNSDRPTYSEQRVPADIKSDISDSRTLLFVKEEIGHCNALDNISNASRTTVMGPIRGLECVTLSDTVERLKKRVTPVNLSEIDNDDDSSNEDDAKIDCEQSEWIKKSIASLKCKFCNKKFTKRDSIKRHIRIHTGEKPYQCPFCEKYFSCSSSRTKHVRIHFGEKPYFCKLCGSKFSQNSSLKQHALKQHDVVKPAFYAGRSVDGPSMKNFIEALNAKKEGRSNLTDTESVEKSSLLLCENGNAKPISKHTGISEYDIDGHSAVMDKDKSISQYQALVEHGNSKHCAVCSQSFSSKAALRRHFLIHSGERPYKCHVCSRGFTQSSSLKRHIQNLHKTTGKKIQEKKPFKGRRIQRRFSHDRSHGKK